MRRTHLAIVLISVNVGGCASMAGPIAKSAVTGGLQGLNEPQNREMTKAIMMSPEISEGTRQLAMSATQGLLAEISRHARTPETQKALDDLATELTASLDREMEPRIRAWTAAAIRSSLDEATNQKSREALAGLTRSLVQSIEEELARGVREDLTPAIHEGLKADLGEILTVSSREIARGVTQGMRQDVAEQQAQNPDAFSAKADRLLGRLLRWTRVGGLIVILACAWLAYRFLRPGGRRRHREVTTASAISPELLRPFIREELRQILQDPVATESLMRELHRDDSHPH